MHLFKPYAHFCVYGFSQFFFVVCYSHISLSLKFNKDPSFDWGDICKHVQFKALNYIFEKLSFNYNFNIVESWDSLIPTWSSYPPRSPILEGVYFSCSKLNKHTYFKKLACRLVGELAILSTKMNSAYVAYCSPPLPIVSPFSKRSSPPFPVQVASSAMSWLLGLQIYIHITVCTFFVADFEFCA